MDLRSSLLMAYENHQANRSATATTPADDERRSLARHLGMDPEHIALETGQADPQGVSLKPEHVMSTLMAAGGLDAAELQSEPIPALLA